MKITGRVNRDAMQEAIDYLYVNADENYLYTRNLSKYAELNQDLYLWVIQETALDLPDSDLDWYYNENGKMVSRAAKFVVEAEKLNRAELPPLNLILQTFLIGSWSSNEDMSTTLRFNFPSATENRKFTLKIGKVTDNNILIKIQNNDYTGITDLLAYAKNNEAVYTQQLTTTNTAYFRSDNSLFDGKKLLDHKAYYFIYAVFDDENGKYYPIEGVTLGQAYLSEISNYWDLYAYTSSEFNWDNLSPTYTITDSTTIVNAILPKTGTSAIILASVVIAISVIGIVSYKKYSNFKDIK